MEVDGEPGKLARVAQLVEGLEEDTEEFVQSNPLHNSAKCGNIIKIRRLIVTEKCPVDGLDGLGNTPLLTTFSNSSSNRLDIVQTLVKLGADVNAKTRDGCLTPLQLCCSTKPPDFLQVTEYLINVGADVYVKENSFNRNLIHMASLRFNALEYHHYLTLMIGKGHSGLLYEVDLEGNTPLHMATRLELHRDTLQLFKDHGTDFNVRNFRENTVLDESVSNKKSESFLKCLRMFGALSVVDIPPETSVEPPGEIKRRKLKVCEATEKPSSPPKVPSIKVPSVSIDWKVEFSKVIEKIKNNVQLTEVLVDELNAEWVRNCVTGNSLLHAAAYFRNAELAKILLTMEYDANFVGNHGYTPLQSCLENNSENALEITQMLLEHRAEVDLKPVYKHSSFHLCTVRKPPDWIQVFCSLFQLSRDTAGALEVAKSNLSSEEFVKLTNFLKSHQNNGNSCNEVDSRDPNDDRILELALQLEEEKVPAPTQCDAMSMTVEASGDGEVLSDKDVDDDEMAHSQLFKCSQCQNEFETSLKLQQHIMQVHKGEKMFECHLCSHKVKTAQGYEIHLRTHTLEKPFLCHQCGKRFMAHSGLHKHLTSHTGTRPFKCTQCHKTFALKSILKEHIKTHGDALTPFGCNTCEKKFRFKKGLTRHQRSHFEHQKYCCQVCDRVFDRKDNLNRHYIRLHSNAST